MFANDDEVLNDFRALTDSDVLIAIATNDGFDLKQFYKIDENSREIYFENYGLWRQQSGIVDERTTKIISRRRENLRGKLITSSYVALHKDSWNHLTDFRDKSVDAILKLNYIILNEILDKLNVTKKELYQGTWGYYDPNTKKWTGMVGDLVHNGADIGGRRKRNSSRRTMINANCFLLAGTPLFMTPNRLPYIEYTNLNVPTALKFIFRAPQLSAGKQFAWLY